MTINPIERFIVRALLERLTADGYQILVPEEDGGRDRWSTDVETLLPQLWHVGFGRIRCHKPGVINSWVCLSYGDGEDVIQDYGVSLEPIIGQLLDDYNGGNLTVTIIPREE